MKTIQEIKSNFEQILEEVIKINGLAVESATQVATAILQESGKFERTEMLNGNNGNRSSNGKPATFSQKRALRNLGIKYNNNIDKTEASKLIEQAVQRFNGRNQ